MISPDLEVNVKGKFTYGKHCHIGPGVKIKANNVHIGDHFYCSGDLVIGGGGSHGKNANLYIGSRCTMHKGFINVCEEVYIGNDVGFSHDVAIITHGFWKNVMQGYPRKFAEVVIGSGCILGYRAMVLAGVHIANNNVIGAGSVVTKNLLEEKGIYGGNPARLLRTIKEPTKDQRREIFEDIYFELENEFDIRPDYPAIWLGDFGVNTTTSYHEGPESEETDRFRDALRKYGIRVYTERPFG
jgi:acetyltransferase-like isoleucine patch superfamily enzyme